MSVIVTEQLTRRYGLRRGIEGVDLKVPEGVLFGFLGPNGSGKTTTIRVLMGFLRPTTGTARIHGLDCWKESHRIKNEVGYLPGDLRLYPGASGNDLLRIFGAIRGRDLRAAGAELAERFILDLSVSVRKMSRGMRQKLGLILALAHRPRLLILDEPTASLDPLMQVILIRHLRELAAAGHTVFFSSHSLSEVERLCDRVAIVRDGRLVADETLAGMREKARRSITIEWQRGVDSSAISVPKFLEIHERDDRTWSGSLHGTAGELIGWLHAKPVADLILGRPDLDSLFRRYYEQGSTKP